jgi:two-component system, OmpR family, KDP operon response regulator KdpE
VSRPSSARVLVVDDEPAILRVVRTNLGAHGFQVDSASHWQQARELLSHRPDVILLDLGLPDADGIEIIRELRSYSSTPIVVLSARTTERDKVAALDLGADDYLTKPFGVDELLARIRVALRHSARPSSGAQAVFRAGDLEIDFERRRVSVGGGEVHLTPTEYDLIKALATHPDKVMTDRMLLQQVWGVEYGSEDHYLHVYVARLRKKLEADPQNPRFLITEPGVGYRLLTEDI